VVRGISRTGIAQRIAYIRQTCRVSKLKDAESDRPCEEAYDQPDGDCDYNIFFYYLMFGKHLSNLSYLFVGN